MYYDIQLSSVNHGGNATKRFFIRLGRSSSQPLDGSIAILYKSSISDHIEHWSNLRQHIFKRLSDDFFFNIMLTFSPFPPNIKHQTASLCFNDNACLLYLFFLQLHPQYSAYFLFFSPHHCLSRRSHSLPFPPLLYQAHLCYPSWLSWSAADGRTWTDAPWWTQ